MKNIKTKLVLVAVAVVLLTWLVSAGSWVDTTTPTTEERYNLTESSDTTRGGNISKMDLGQEVQTAKWAAYYGNLTGSVSLRNNDGSASVFNWAWSASDGAEVCAISTASDFDWATLAVSTANEVDTAWGFTTADTDSANNTVSTTEDFDIAGSGTLSAPSFSTGPETNGNDTFETGLLEDGGASVEEDFAFCVNANDTGTAYDNTSADYELMVPTNQTAGQTQTYYFYVELN